MAQAMKGVSKAMMNMNKQMNLPQIQQILHEFEKQSEIMDMKEEMINDAIDDAMEDEGDEEEGDAIVSQVLDELGLQLSDTLSGLPQVIHFYNQTSGQINYNLLQLIRHLDRYLFRELNNHKLLPLELELLEVVAVQVVVPQVDQQHHCLMLMQTYRLALIV